MTQAIALLTDSSDAAKTARSENRVDVSDFLTVGGQGFANQQLLVFSPSS